MVPQSLLLAQAIVNKLKEHPEMVDVAEQLVIAYNIEKFNNPAKAAECVTRNKLLILRGLERGLKNSGYRVICIGSHAASDNKLAHQLRRLLKMKDEP